MSGANDTDDFIGIMANDTGDFIGIMANSLCQGQMILTILLA